MTSLKTIEIFLFLTLPLIGFSQKLYLKTFGNNSKPAILFLHGGPGYNSASFEATSAQTLADAGFFVIVYDRRGEGRSADKKAAYSFEQSMEDINGIINRFHFEKIHLMGHSFGGMLAIKYAAIYPDKVSSIILLSAPLDLQACFKTIISSCRKIYETKQDSLNLNYISMLEKMDTTSLSYSSYSFMHAMSNNFYSPDSLSAEAKMIYKQLKKDSLFKYITQMDYQAPYGFWKNDQYTTLNLTAELNAIKASSAIPIYGIYGQEDGLYSSLQLKELKEILDKNHLITLKNCSHSVFIDQRSQFVQAIKKWLKE